MTTPIDVQPHFRTAQFYTENNVRASGDTGGWDTMYLVHGSVVNQAIAKHFSERKNNDDFRMQINIDGDEYRIDLDAVIGPWTVVGGSGRMMKIFLPIVSGTAEIETRHIVKLDLTGVSLALEVELGFHAPPDLQSDKSTQFHLKVVTQHIAPPVVTAASAADSKTAIDKINKELSESSDKFVVADLTVIGRSKEESDAIAHNSMVLKEVARDWLFQNSAIFDYTFLKIDIAEEAAVGDFTWIKPTTVAYAVTETSDKSDLLFGILSMTEGRSAHKLSCQIPANAIPINSEVNAAFFISPQMLMKKILTPHVHTLFEGAKAEDFTISEGGKSIVNKNELHIPIHLEPELYFFQKKDVSGKIAPNAFGMEINETHLTTNIRNVSLFYGTNDEIDLLLTYDSDNTVGIDEYGHFSLQTTRTDPHAVPSANAQRMVEKVWWDIGKAVAIQVCTALLMSGIGYGCRVLVSRWASVGAKAVTGAVEGASATSAAELVETKIITEMTEAAEAEIASAVRSGESVTVKAVPPVAKPTWSAFKKIANEFEAVVSDMRNNTVKYSVAKFLGGFFSNSIVQMMVGQFAISIQQKGTERGLASAYHEDPTKMRSLVHFTEDCISSTVWPHTESAELRVAGLNTSLVLGMKLK